MSDQELLDQLSRLAEDEDTKRATEQKRHTDALITLQGQISGLVSLLRQKDIISQEDVRTWEIWSAASEQALHTLLQVNAEREQASTAEEAYQATRAGLLAAKEIAKRISPQGAANIDDQLAQLEEIWKQENKCGS